MTKNTRLKLTNDVTQFHMSEELRVVKGTIVKTRHAFPRDFPRKEISPYRRIGRIFRDLWWSVNFPRRVKSPCRNFPTETFWQLTRNRDRTNSHPANIYIYIYKVKMNLNYLYLWRCNEKEYMWVFSLTFKVSI